MNFFNKFDRLKVKYKDNPSIKISFLLGVISMLFIFVSGSYAFIFKSTYTQSINTISAGSLVITLENTTPVISINNGVPTPDDIGLKEESSYNFTLKNTGSINAKYKISLINSCAVGSSYTVDGSSVSADVCVPTRYVKAGISKDGEDFKVVKVDDDGNIILDGGVLDNLKSSSYKLKLWLDYDTPNDYNVNNKNVIMSYKIQLYSEQTTEGYLDASGANAPALSSNMIPVYYDSSSDSWKKADNDNKDKNNKWYDYDNKMWANVVTVSNTNRDTYLKASAGTPISMDDINTMWVWIPRYTYTYLNTSTPEEIKIKFESGTNSSGTIKCTDSATGESSTSESCIDTTNNGLVAGTSTYTHPAFTFGDQELTGIWVGKFEVSSDTTCTPADYSAVGSGCNLQTIRPNIKPNVQSWRGAQVGTFFNGINKMTESGNKYGFSTTDDAHMMKNIEWGAVTYLSHSKYGINKEVALNSQNTYTTGCGPQSEGSTSSDATCNAYNTTLGQSASTTGNVYGVYDMSGGSREYVMGDMVWTNGQMMSGYRSANNSNSAFTGYLYSGGSFTGTYAFPAAKYYDKYSYGTSSSEYTRGKLGDATKEMAPARDKSWYSDEVLFPSSSNSWFSRGGSYGIGKAVGLFNFGFFNGDSTTIFSARAVLAGAGTLD